MEYHQILREYEKALFDELPIDEIEKMASITKHVAHLPVKNAVKQISLLISTSKIKDDSKKKYLERLSQLDLHLFEDTYNRSKEKITDVDISYIICFAVGIKAKDVGLLFNIESTSVHKLRYRIKKKIAENDMFRAIL